MKKSQRLSAAEKDLSGPDKPKRKFHTTPGYKFNPETGNRSDHRASRRRADPFEPGRLRTHTRAGGAKRQAGELDQVHLRLARQCFRPLHDTGAKRPFRRTSRLLLRVGVATHKRRRTPANDGATDKEWKASWLAVKRMFYEQAAVYGRKSGCEAARVSWPGSSSEGTRPRSCGRPNMGGKTPRCRPLYKL